MPFAKQELPPLLDLLLCHRPTVECVVHGHPTVEHLAVVRVCSAATLHVRPMNLTLWPSHALSQVWLTLILPLARLTLLRVSSSGDDLLDSFEQSPAPPADLPWLQLARVVGAANSPGGLVSVARKASTHSFVSSKSCSKINVSFLTIPDHVIR